MATEDQLRDYLRRATVDLTEAHAVLGVMGPRSRALLQGLTDADLGDGAFGFSTSQELTLAGVELRATRITYVGELGWELMVPVEHAGTVYDAVSAAGAVDAGYSAIESLRLEKGYRAFGRDLSPDYGPVEAGLTFTCKLKTDIPFLGREAVERSKAAGARQRLGQVADRHGVQAGERALGQQLGPEDDDDVRVQRVELGADDLRALGGQVDERGRHTAGGRVQGRGVEVQPLAHEGQAQGLGHREIVESAP